MTEQFGIQIENNDLVSEFAIENNKKTLLLREWQVKAIKFFYDNNKKVMYECATGCIDGDSLIEMPRDLIKYPDGIPIKNLVGEKNFYVYTLNIKTDDIELKKVKDVWLDKYNEDVYELITNKGKKIIATKNHPFIYCYREHGNKGANNFNNINLKVVKREYRELEKLKVGDWITTYNSQSLSPDGRNIRTSLKPNIRSKLEHRFIIEQIYGKLNNKDVVHHIDENRYNNTLNNLKIMSNEKHGKYHTTKRKFYGKQLWNKKGHPKGFLGKQHCDYKNKKETFYDKYGFDMYKHIPGEFEKRSLYSKKGIKKIEYDNLINRSKNNGSKKYCEKIIAINYIGKKDVYDMEVEDNHNFIANNFIIHNTGKTRLGIELIKKVWKDDPECMVLIVVPKNVILESGWYKDLYENGISLKDIGVYYGSVKEYGKVTITNMQSLSKVAINLFKMVIFDECFSGDTKISVKVGKLNKQVKLKNIVEQKKKYNIYSYNFKTKKIELKPITNWFEIDEEREVYDILLEDGTKLTGTPEQLIYTNNGYKQICDLKENDEVIKKYIGESCINCGNHVKTKNAIFCHNCIKNKKQELVDKNLIKNTKGKTWEQIYGIKGARKFQEKRRLTRLGVKLNRTKSSYKKGKTYEEIYGKQRSKIIKEKFIKTQINNKFFWTKQRIIDAYLNIPNIRKNQWREYTKQKKLPDETTAIKFFGSLDNLATVTNKLFLEKRKRFGRMFGFNETKILNIIEKQKNIKILRQYKIKINNKKYFVDGYDKENNIVYEVDEDHHSYFNIQDNIRQNNIKKLLNCKFIRINEKEYLKNINNGVLNDFKIC